MKVYLYHSEWQLNCSGRDSEADVFGTLDQATEKAKREIAEWDETWGHRMDAEFNQDGDCINKSLIWSRHDEYYEEFFTIEITEKEI